MATATDKKHELALRDHFIKYPEVHEDFPWGHRTLKVKGKAFVFLSHEGEQGLSLSVKLGASHETALLLPFVEPTGYGLGKSGWVSARFPDGETPPMPILMAWIDESYRLIAPKRVSAPLPPLEESEREKDGGEAARPARTTGKATPRARSTGSSMRARGGMKAAGREQGAARD
jgi:predicted DNA-binding protein (MmcQ/YjbR family)